MSGGTPAYSVSKTALNALTRMLAGELRNTGILVNSVCPGWVATDMGGDGSDLCRTVRQVWFGPRFFPTTDRLVVFSATANECRGKPDVTQEHREEGRVGPAYTLSS